ncbi:MAG: M1 family metallopeptidase [Bacteroidetes Order II. Incertae sedis bacterium]|nr:M1 family metallopeptidase [Bacteroidetes Order II. bacterium]
MIHRFWRILPIVLLLGMSVANAQYWLQPGDGKTNNSQFRPIPDWPTPNEYRTSSGAPGPKYWQQKVDYKIDVTLDTTAHKLIGKERVTYKNNSPDVLRFIWVQMDQNLSSLNNSRNGKAAKSLPSSIPPAARRFLNVDPFDGGYNVTRVQVMNAQGKLVNADYWLNDTIMKINLPAPLQSGGTVVFDIDWNHIVPDNGRGAKEKIADGWLYLNAQWFPRVSVYDDVNGWQTDQYLGRGEFHLEFGDYEVNITVPWNHIVGSTGVLQNPAEVLTAEQQRRVAKALTVTDLKNADPVFIVGPNEVNKAAFRPKSSGMLTWKFKAQNVRDFSWASSKTFVWDAAGYKYRPTDKAIQLNSYYPRAAMPLWDKASTRATWETLYTYGRMSLEYPYPQASNVNGPVGGMEYPMIAFCGGRPNKEGKFNESQERALISVTIHEVGHNWFPMIISSDERKWTWQDEGINSFYQYYSENDYAARYTGTKYGEQFKEGKYDNNRNLAKGIVPYMRQKDQVPIMIHSDLIHTGFGPNGYTKPAAGLWILREHVLGPKAFDEAFKEYSQKWAFKHPSPYDFFRTMEDGAGEDLAWFWRGWMYSTYANDQAIAEVKSQKAADLVGDEKRGKNYWRVTIENKGGMLMPVVMEVTYDDGSKERMKLPVDIWRYNELKFEKGFFSDKNVSKVVLDPDEVFSDVDTKNNTWDASKLEQPKPQEAPGTSGN